MKVRPADIRDAIELATLVESLCPAFGCHVALTGGTLYKAGPRKDIDLLFYRIRQVDTIDRAGLLYTLEQNGFTLGARKGWVRKATYLHRHGFTLTVDLFFPELPAEWDNAPGDGDEYNARCSRGA
jgi:hypothetical protein